MANAEVSVPVGDVVVVPTEGNEGENPEDTKTQVILQLQPVQQGIYEAGSENSAAVVAVETHTIHKIEEGIDASSIEANEDMEIAYPITCGESKAVLLWKKFVCPGINVKCVKFNDQLISPKHFVHLAGKSTLKDWKRAIRLGGIMLRKMMDSGQIDFYQHDKVCSNTCRSTKFDLLISSARAPVPGQQTSVVQTPTSADGNITQIAISEESMEEAGLEWNSALTAAVTMATEEGIKKESEEISEDTLMFWKGIADVGLMEEVVCNIQKEIEELLRGVQQRLIHAPFQVTDAAVLNNVANTFGLMDTVKRVLDNRRKQVEHGEEQFLYTLADLERQLEEQKKQAQDPRLKSQTVQNVVLMPVSTPKPPKRPRLQRPASTTVLSPSPVQQPQFTVISPITITPVGQSFSMGNIPVATLSQGTSPVTVHTLPSGPQLFRYATVVSSAKSNSPDTVTIHPSSSLALLSSTSMQDGSTLGNMATMVSPVELVAMESGLTSAIQAVESTSEDGQTIIEIDPAPDPEADDPEGKAVILETELRTEEKVVANMEERQHQVHNVEIVVLED
ncbi:similar to Glucocorticoid modulatory element binding protein 1 (predicted) [Rattus norvegicus]|uniref:Glucocorticoid modulatory element-binding protein 1 n=1 Tax=Rattus norvegicus TaxID=10116 RepID=GMEB1_RAT|nr:glucocorticoid modulatory element-binding protein 1 [Rattus norvegicus]XP_008762389.1 glucocorticoid modulatory element-binding protein 1 isoform X1 [Rattus norvegicus]XP_038966541.1 glucocorticoid modulatory element-binding protein 1 isoform X1 [Rattus norvegicus]XP_038966542.1 glucocorticoid modulatory element-binding protein 1 isoform X1 [Rattus norvegicus]Q9QUZ8.3 RecName: Full=Glucocorticoid modulatory element-binding protein 1; Short=GMEB-1 [Rattus norvegicus]AAI58641.1 Glucocorticoid|eukprot:NP_001102738.1 glucocorticoid modulatory element-binding protein 1 [Rattus norvegicus]